MVTASGKRGTRAAAAGLARALHDKKGEDISVLDVHGLSPLGDFLILATALSRPHLKTLLSEVERAAADCGLPSPRRSQPPSDRWAVIDFGAIMVHVMSREAREFYGLERLFPDAPQVPW